MDINPYPLHTHYSQSLPHQFHHVPAIISRSYYPPLPYPYTWYVYINQAVIINVNDLNNYQQVQQPSVHRGYYPYAHLQPNDDEVLILDGFDHEAEDYNYSLNGGLTKKVVNKNLKISSYCGNGEQGEVCVICQEEFKRKEMLAVLKCKHRYHPACIKEWLMRQNVCPVCKAQALMVEN